MKFNISKQIQFRLLKLTIRLLAFRANQLNPSLFNKNDAGSATSQNTKHQLVRHLVFSLISKMGIVPTFSWFYSPTPPWVSLNESQLNLLTLFNTIRSLSTYFGDWYLLSTKYLFHLISLGSPYISPYTLPDFLQTQPDPLRTNADSAPKNLVRDTPPH